MVLSIQSSQKYYIPLAVLSLGTLAFLFLRSRRQERAAVEPSLSQRSISLIQNIPVVKTVWNYFFPLKTELSKLGKKELVQVYEENLRCVEQQYYVNSKGQHIPLAHGSKLAANSQVYTINFLQNDTIRFERRTTPIEVVVKDSLSAAKEQIDLGYKVAVLNFASPSEPGGGIADGTLAQEETLCYASPELSSFMTEELTKSPSRFYPLKKRDAYDSKDRLFVTPNVAICRGNYEQNFQFLDQPFSVGVISAAAPCLPKLKINEDKSVSYANREDEEYMKKCIYAQLAAAYNEDYDCIIIGAFGCGAFKNPPDHVAKLYHDELTKLPSSGILKKIVFAILPDPTTADHNPRGNLQPFLDLFP